jgi:PBP1b-binding outer membrane lipoprotein LpoB
MKTKLMMMIAVTGLTLTGCASTRTQTATERTTVSIAPTPKPGSLEHCRQRHVDYHAGRPIARNLEEKQRHDELCERWW